MVLKNGVKAALVFFEDAYSSSISAYFEWESLAVPIYF